MTSNLEISSPTSPTRMSVNLGRLSMPTSSSQKCENCGSNNEQSDSTSYKWQVPSIGTKRHYREPDVRSNAARSSNCETTVRRHIPRGRTRDLVKLFDRMAKDAVGGTESLRAKSLPPPKQRTDFNRSRSVQRRADSSIQIGAPKSESKTQFEIREPLTKKLSLLTQDIVNENLMNSFQRLIVSSERNDCIDTHPLSFHGLNLAKGQLTGEIRIDAVNEDEVVSNASADKRRWTSSPIESRDESDLSNAFGHLLSIDSLNIFAILGSKYAASAFNGSTHFSEHNSAIDVHNENREKRTLDEPDSHCEQPAPLKEAPPPQRLSLSHRNSTQSASSFQHRQSPDGQQCRSSLYCVGFSYAREHYFSASQHQSTNSCQESHSTRRYNEIEQDKVDAEIDRLFEFTEERDDLNAVGCETFSERKISVLKHGDAQTVRDDGVSHLPEFFPKTSQPSMPCSIYSLKQPCSDCPLKHSCEMNLILALSAFRIPPRLVSQELRGTMTISNITVRLSRHFCRREPNHDCSYAFLILLKCGTEVQATAPTFLFAHDQVRARQLTFTEHIQFVNLPVDFNVAVEVCTMELPISNKSEQSCATNIAKKCLNVLNSASYSLHGPQEMTNGCVQPRPVVLLRADSSELLETWLRALNLFSAQRRTVNPQLNNTVILMFVASL